MFEGMYEMEIISIRQIISPVVGDQFERLKHLLFLQQIR
jgi:hypothetical protein